MSAGVMVRSLARTSFSSSPAGMTTRAPLISEVVPPMASLTACLASLLLPLAPLGWRYASRAKIWNRFHLGPFLAAMLVGRGKRVYLLALVIRLGGERAERALHRWIEHLGWAAMLLLAALVSWLLLRGPAA